MDTMRPLGGAAVLLIAVGLGGIGASLVTNDLFTGDTGYAAPVAVTTIIFIGAILAFMAVGRPWKLWERTEYW